MRHDHEARSPFARDGKQHVGHKLTGGAIKVARRLIGENQLRSTGESAGDGDPLSFPSGQLSGIMMRASRQAHSTERRTSKGVDIPKPCNLEGNPDIVERCHGLQQVKRLKNETDAPSPQASELILSKTGQGRAQKTYFPR